MPFNLKNLSFMFFVKDFLTYMFEYKNEYSLRISSVLSISDLIIAWMRPIFVYYFLK